MEYGGKCFYYEANNSKKKTILTKQEIQNEMEETAS